ASRRISAKGVSGGLDSTTRRWVATRSSTPAEKPGWSRRRRSTIWRLASAATPGKSQSVPSASKETARTGTASAEEDLELGDDRVVVQARPFDHRVGAPEGEEHVRQGDGGHLAGQLRAGKGLEHGGPEPSALHVVLQRDGEPVPVDPVRQPRVQRLHPAVVDDRALHPLLAEG